MSNLEKNTQIKEKGAQTKLRHKSMCCRVYTLKIKENKLNNTQRESLERYFVSAKWIYNYIISNIDDIFNFNYHNYPIITHKNKFGEDISIKVSDYLPAQFYQQIGKDIQSSIKTLSSRKKKGFKVGKLKCKSSCNCISINQYKKGYQLYPSCNSIHIAGIKKDIKVSGLHQIPPNAELCNSKLIRNASSYFLKVTTFEPIISKPKTNKVVGIDMNISNTLTTSDGKVIDKIFVEETERMKRLQRHNLKCKQKGSNNRYKLNKQIKKYYEKLTNIKNDISNKIVHDLINNYDEIFIQDEMLTSWHSNKINANTVQHSCLGRIKSKLRQSNKVFMIDRKYTTTKLCSCCHHKQDISINDRQYICPNCGLDIARDVNSAINILQIGQKLKNIGTGHTEFKPVEICTSSDVESNISKAKYESMNQEAITL